MAAPNHDLPAIPRVILRGSTSIATTVTGTAEPNWPPHSVDLLVNLDDRRFELLCEACRPHTDGDIEVTVPWRQHLSPG